MNITFGSVNTCTWSHSTDITNFCRPQREHWHVSEQCIETAAGHHGESPWQRERRAYPLQHEPQATGESRRKRNLKNTCLWFTEFCCRWKVYVYLPCMYDLSHTALMQKGQQLIQNLGQLSDRLPVGRSVTSLSTARKYNHIWNVLEKMLGCAANWTYTVYLYVGLEDWMCRLRDSEFWTKKEIIDTNNDSEFIRYHFRWPDMSLFPVCVTVHCCLQSDGAQYNMIISAKPAFKVISRLLNSCFSIFKGLQLHWNQTLIFLMKRPAKMPIIRPLLISQMAYYENSKRPRKTYNPPMYVFKGFSMSRMKIK